jgi:nucleotide-binding universal stress UspA family protein
MYERILVPVDGSPTSTQGLDEAIKLAKLTGASLRLVHVVNELTFATGFEFYTGDVIGMLKEAGEQVLAEAKARVQASGLDAVTFLAENFGSRVCDIVVDEATKWKADLIVIGSHGRRGVGRLVIGSDAEQIVRMAAVPVLLVRALATKAEPIVAPARDTTAPVRSAVPA